MCPWSGELAPQLEVPGLRRPLPAKEQGAYGGQLELMLQGLSAADLPPDTLLLALPTARPSVLDAFHWAPCASRPERCRVLRDLMPSCGELGLILFLADLCDDEQHQGLLELVFHLDGNQDAPPLLCIQVSPLGQVGAAQAGRLVERVDAAIDLGLQDVITGGRCGPRLALQVRTSVLRENAIMRKLNAEIDARRQEVHQNQMLRFHTSSILWQDLPQRMRLAIPLADLAAEEEETEHGAAGRQFGEPVLRGCWGWVRQARHGQPKSSSDGGCSGATDDSIWGQAECVKIIVKNEVTTLASLRAIHHMISCMQEVSSEEGRHPNVLQLLEVTSTRDHLYLHMEHGHRCLHQRLLESKKALSAPRRLTGSQLRSLSSQVVAAVHHLHERRICHRDLKPESFLFYEDVSSLHGEADVLLKLTNLDLAIRQPEGVLFGTSCGTAPFAAPEVSVAMRGRYDGLRADLWSVGITLLEIFAGVGVLEDIVRGPGATSTGSHYSSMELLLDVQHFFSRPGAVHDACNRLVLEARQWRSRLEQALVGLLLLAPEERRDARWLAATLVGPEGGEEACAAGAFSLLPVPLPLPAAALLAARAGSLGGFAGEGANSPLDLRSPPASGVGTPERTRGPSMGVHGFSIDSPATEGGRGSPL